jgi:hypothetical protein
MTQDRDTTPTQNYDLPKPKKRASWAAEWDELVETLDEQLAEASQTYVSQTVAAGETVTIPSGKGLTVAGPLTVDGEIQLDGTLTVVPGPITGEGSISGDGRIYIP